MLRAADRLREIPGADKAARGLTGEHAPASPGADHRTDSLDRAAPRRRPRLLALTLALGLLSFAVHERLGRAFEGLGVFDQADVLFDADPVAYLRAFRDGEVREKRRLRHLNVRNTVNPPIKLISRGATVAGLGEDEGRVSHRLALLVAPAAAGITTAAVFLLFLRLGAPVAGAVLLALLELCSFSSLVFGAMPESYPLSGAVLAFTFLLAAEAMQSGRVRPLAWVATGTLAFGFTTTNIGLVAIPLYFVQKRLRGSFGRAVTATAMLAAAAVVLGLVQYYVVGTLYGDRVGLRRLAKTPEPFLGIYVEETAWAFPPALAATVLPASPTLVESELGIRRDSRFKTMFTVVRTTEAPLLWLLRIGLAFGFLVLGGLAHRRDPQGPAYPLFLAALACVAFNWALHSFFWHTDLLLYSKHWHVALLVILGGSVLRGGSRRAAWALALLAAFAAWNSFAILRSMLKLLAAGGS